MIHSMKSTKLVCCWADNGMSTHLDSWQSKSSLVCVGSFPISQSTIVCINSSSLLEISFIRIENFSNAWKRDDLSKYKVHLYFVVISVLFSGIIMNSTQYCQVLSSAFHNGGQHIMKCSSILHIIQCARKFIIEQHLTPSFDYDYLLIKESQ